MLKKLWNFRIYEKSLEKSYWIFKLKFEDVYKKENFVMTLWMRLSALVVDETVISKCRSCSPKCWKNHEIFEFSWKFGRKTPGSGNLHLRSSLWRKFREWIINEVICSTRSRRKPGWRFTAGSTFSKSNTETVAKPDRLGLAQKGKLMHFSSS